MSQYFRQKKADSNAIGVLAMRKARIFNYYNKRSHKGNEKNYRVHALTTQALNVIKLHLCSFISNKRMQ